ncbi:MAG: hypothetical protein PWQ55_1331 [Chloroflexota bacterium]|nr:hypothetical protein [Chloroflexota bacterium]
MDRSIYIEPLALAILVFCAGVLFIAFRRLFRVHARSAELTLPVRIGSGAVEIPLLESFSGLRGWGIFNLSDNSLYPSLVLYDHWMEYRVLAKRTADYSAIESVHGIRFLFLRVALFTFRDRSLTFGARVANVQVLENLLAFFRAQGVEVR